MSLKLKEKVAKLKEASPDLFVPINQIGRHEGYEEGFITFLGFSKQEVKKLVRDGIMMMGYSKNEWNAGETPRGHPMVKPGFVFKGTGSRKRFVFVGPAVEEVVTTETTGESDVG